MKNSKFFLFFLLFFVLIVFIFIWRFSVQDRIGEAPNAENAEPNCGCDPPIPPLATGSQCGTGTTAVMVVTVPCSQKKDCPGSCKYEYTCQNLDNHPPITSAQGAGGLRRILPSGDYIVNLPNPPIALCSPR